jgi:hypothetical protein
LTSKLKVAVYDHDPGSTDAKLAGPDGGTTIRYFDMRDYSHFMALVMVTIVAAGGTTKVEIVASATTAFSAVTVIKDSGTVAADAVGDYVVLECSAEEIAQEGADAGVELRYVAVRTTQATNTDEGVVVYVATPRHAYSGLTANAIA